MADDPMDVENAVRTLNDAIELQFRSAIEFAFLAATVSGPQWHGLATTFGTYAAVELADAQRLVEKVVALGGRPPTAVRGFASHDDPEQAVRSLIEHEEETLAALHAVIPFSGQEPRSEALEHLMEHLLLRKQSQVDALRRLVS